MGPTSHVVVMAVGCAASLSMGELIPGGCEDGGRGYVRVVDENPIDGGIDTTSRRIFSRSFVSALLEYVGLSRMIDSVEVRIVAVSRLPM